MGDHAGLFVVLSELPFEVCAPAVKRAVVLNHAGVIEGQGELGDGLGELHLNRERASCGVANAELPLVVGTKAEDFAEVGARAGCAVSGSDINPGMRLDRREHRACCDIAEAELPFVVGADAGEGPAEQCAAVIDATADAKSWHPGAGIDGDVAEEKRIDERACVLVRIEARKRGILGHRDIAEPPAAACTEGQDGEPSATRLSQVHRSKVGQLEVD